jgi:hypothetical protein
MHCPLSRWPEEGLWKALKSYTVVFHTNNTDWRYGQVLYWKENGAAEDFVRRGLALHPGHGVQVLVIQMLTYTFLLDCARALLGESKLPEEINDVAAVLPGLTTGGDFRSMRAAAIEAPYRVAGRLDFARLRALVSARIGDLEDHTWTLREDPGYFAETWQSYKEHRVEDIRDSNGRRHPRAQLPLEVLLGHILRDVVINPYYSLYLWQHCLRLVLALEAMHTKYRDHVDFRQDLPKEYFEVFLELRYLLCCLSTDLHHCVRMGMMGSPRLRRYWFRTSNCMPNDVRMEYRREEITKSETTRRFFEIYDAIMMWDSPTFDGCYAELDQLERLFENDEAKDLIDPYVASFLSQLSVAAQCIHQLRLYQPWATKVECALVQQDIGLKFGYAALTSRWDGIMMRYFASRELVHMADPTDGKFAYPVGKRRCRTTVRRVRTSEENLDSLWSAIDAYCKKHTQKTLNDLLDESIGRGRTIQRTAPWVDPPKAWKKASDIKSKSVPTQPVPKYQPLSILDHDSARTITGSFDKLCISTKEKVKTKGTTLLPAAEQHDANLPGPIETVEEGFKPAFLVDSRSLRVFQALFHNPSEKAAPGDIPWTDFLHAMVSVGFAVEKMHGSAWQFTPKDVHKSIQFHEPHPSSKLPFNQARRYGRRLASRYGWSGEMFQLE